MDIKNILNDGERRTIQQQPHPPYQERRYAHPSSAAHHQAASAVIHNPSTAYTYETQTHQQLQKAHQIVYTGPVYQLPAALPPAVEVRHMGNTIQYRYAPYHYEEPPPVDYVYQEYAEIPRQQSQLYEYSYGQPTNQSRQVDPHQQYRPRSYYPERNPVPAGDPYANQNRDLQRHSSQDMYLKRQSYTYSDPYMRDSLVSRVVPVDGGYQYKPVPENPRQSPNDARYHHENYRCSRYTSSQPRGRPDYNEHSHDRYRNAYHSYKRSRSNSPRAKSTRKESYLEEPQRTLQPARSYPRQRRRHTTSQNSCEAEDTDQYKALKPGYGDSNSRRKTMASGNATSIATDACPQSERVKVEPSVANELESSKIANKKMREQAKNTVIDSGQETVSDHSQDAPANFADSSPTVTERRLQNSRPSPDGWSSDDIMTLKEYQQQADRRDAKRPRQNSAKRIKKRRLIPTSSQGVERSGDGRSSIENDDQPLVRPAKKSRAKNSKVQEKNQKRKAFCPNVSTGKGSMVEEILDGADSSGQKIAIDTTSSCESDMGAKADIESEGSHRERITLTKHAREHRPKVKPRSRPKKKVAPPFIDPKEPYPNASQDFLGIPPEAVGDLLQVWDFIGSFTKTLRLTSFKLHHLQQAIAHTDRCSLLDACILRLVQAIISDEALVKELRIPSAVTKGLSSRPGKNGVGVILQNLPNILDFESDEQDDHLLQTTVAKLDGSNNKLAFYKVLNPAGKLRVLRELVDYATMADHLRACVSDSMEHAEEEKKKAKEENAANRKRLESQLRELRSELAEYKTKNGLTENGSNADSDRGGSNSIKENGIKSESASVASDGEELLSRKEKLLAARKEKRDQEERREKERGADAIAGRIDKVKTHLKTLKNIRLRNRAKDGDDRPAGPGSMLSPSELHEDPVRTHPIGVDRRKRCYWFFSGSGRVWVEDTDSGEWSSFNDMDSVHDLMKWLSPYRKEEKSLKNNLRQRLELIEGEMIQEKKSMEQAELEEKEAEAAAELAPRTTRAGKRRATQVKAKKKAVVMFLDYRNLER